MPVTRTKGIVSFGLVMIRVIIDDKNVKRGGRGAVPGDGPAAAMMPPVSGLAGFSPPEVLVPIISVAIGTMNHYYQKK